MPGEENTNETLQTGRQENLQGADNENKQNPEDNGQNQGIGEQKPEAGEQKLEGKEEPEKTEIYGSPEKFDYSEIQLPEGMQLDEELLKEFEPIAREMNLSNKSANKLMGLAVKLAEKNFAKLGDFAAELQEAKKNSYLELLNTDEELNVGDEEKYNAYVNVAIQGVQAFATPGFKELIKAEGLTHHPEFIKTFHAVGKQCVSEDIPNPQFPAGQKEINAADVLYGERN